MKILIKTFYGTYEALQNKHFESHCSTYYTYLFREIFRRLGHECNFLGATEVPNEIITNYKDYDVLFFWGLESFLFDLNYSTSVLQNCTGKKILYITTQTKYDIFKYFDYIFPTEIQEYVSFYQTKYPQSKVQLIPFASPMFDLIDKETDNPYNDLNKKVIYTGIVTGRYINVLNYLVEHGINLYVGGIYATPDAKGCRAFTEQELKELFNPNIKWLSKNGNFEYGSHFKYLKHADVGLNFYPSIGLASKPINSKIIDYLVCGLPIVSEDESPNSYRLHQLNAGFTAKWFDLPQILDTVHKALNTDWNKEQIQIDARKIFNPLTIGQQILDGIK